MIYLFCDLSKWQMGTVSQKFDLKTANRAFFYSQCHIDSQVNMTTFYFGFSLLYRYIRDIIKQLWANLVYKLLSWQVYICNFILSWYSFFLFRKWHIRHESFLNQYFKFILFIFILYISMSSLSVFSILRENGKQCWNIKF